MKLLKRSRYGRVGFDLLNERVRYAATTDIPFGVSSWFNPAPLHHVYARATKPGQAQSFARRSASISCRRRGCVLPRGSPTSNRVRIDNGQPAVCESVEIEGLILRLPVCRFTQLVGQPNAFLAAGFAVSTASRLSTLTICPRARSYFLGSGRRSLALRRAKGPARTVATASSSGGSVVPGQRRRSLRPRQGRS